MTEPVKAPTKMQYRDARSIIVEWLLRDAEWFIAAKGDKDTALRFYGEARHRIEEPDR